MPILFFFFFRLATKLIISQTITEYLNKISEGGGEKVGREEKQREHTITILSKFIKRNFKKKKTLPYLTLSHSAFNSSDAVALSDLNAVIVEN